MGKPAPTLYRTYADGSNSGDRAHHSGATAHARTNRHMDCKAVITHATSANQATTTHCRSAANQCQTHKRSDEHTSELQSLMRNSNGVFCLKQKKADVKVNKWSARKIKRTN